MFVNRHLMILRNESERRFAFEFEIWQNVIALDIFIGSLYIGVTL